MGVTLLAVDSVGAFRPSTPPFTPRVPTRGPPRLPAAAVTAAAEECRTVTQQLSQRTGLRKSPRIGEKSEDIANGLGAIGVV